MLNDGVGLLGISWFKKNNQAPGKYPGQRHIFSL